MLKTLFKKSSIRETETEEQEEAVEVADVTENLSDNASQQGELLGMNASTTTPTTFCPLCRNPFNDVIGQNPDQFLTDNPINIT
jgi:hypothetical protein